MDNLSPHSIQNSFVQVRKYKNNVFLLYAVIFFNSLLFVSPIIVPFFSIFGGLTFSEIMSLQSIYILSNILSEIPLGGIADFISRKFSLILAFILTLIAIFFFVAIPKFCMFIFGEIFWGFAASLISGADKALLYDSLLVTGREKDASAFFGKLYTFKLLAFLLAAPIGSIISSTVGIRETMILFLAPIGFALVLSLFLKDSIQKQSIQTKSYGKLLISGFHILFKKKKLTLLFMDALFVTMVCYHTTTTYQQKLLLLEVNQVHFGWIFAVLLISEMLFLNVHNHLMRNFPSKRRCILFLYCLFAGIGMIFLAVSSNLQFICIGIILVAGFGLTYWAISIGYWQIFIPNEERSTVLSTANMLQLMCVVILNPLVGYITEINIFYIFVFSGVFLLLWSIFSPLRGDVLSNTQ